MMVADGKVLNVEREVLRGALDVLSEGQLRTAHMEAMLDAAAKACAAQGMDRRIEAVVESLNGDAVKAELVGVLCAAVAVADDKVTEAEHEVFGKLAVGLGLQKQRLAELVAELEGSVASKP